MRRYQHGTDANHAAVVTALRAVGVSVQSLARMGDGVPDLLIGLLDARGVPVNLLVEIKPGDAKDKRQRALNDNEQKWHARWKGQVRIIESVEDAIALVESVRRAA